MLQKILPKVFSLLKLMSFMTFKSIKNAKIIADAKKHGLFDNIRFRQLRFHCKSEKKKNAFRSGYPEKIGKNQF